MGTSLITCLASGQTIQNHDTCYILPIVQARSYRPVSVRNQNFAQNLYGICKDTCYPHCFWEPLGGLIEATYEDDGFFNLADTPTNRIRLVELFRPLRFRSAVVLEGENRTHDIPFDFPAYAKSSAPGLESAFQAEPERVVRDASLFQELQEAWEYVWTRVLQARLFLVEDSFFFPIQLSVISGAAYEVMLKRRQPESMLKCLRETLASHKWETDLRKLTEDRFRMASMCRSSLGSFEGITYPSESAEFEVFSSVRRKLPEKELEAAFYEILKPRCVVQVLDDLNVKLSPMVFAGQDYGNGIGDYYADFVAETNKVTKDQRAEDN